MKDIYDLRGGVVPHLEVSSKYFNNEGHIPSIFTCDGGNRFPSLLVKGIPEEVETLVLIIDDPDDPEKTFVHLVAWNILSTGDMVMIDEDTLRQAELGINDFGYAERLGPCPPKGDGAHKYYFKVYGIEESINLPEYSEKEDLLNEMDLNNNVVAYGELIGEYER